MRTSFRRRRPLSAWRHRRNRTQGQDRRKAPRHPLPCPPCKKTCFLGSPPCLPPIFGKSGRDSRRRGSFFSLRGLVCEFPWIYIKAIVPSEGKEGAGPLFWGRNSRSPSNTLAGFLRRDAESRPVLFAFRGVAWREWSPRARGLGHLRTPPPSSRGGRTRDFAGLTFSKEGIGC